MKTVVVLGTHGGGTSLLANILQNVGIEMHPNPKAKVRHYLNYEDADFVRMNVQLLKDAGGSWSRPPEERRIIASSRKPQFVKRMPELLSVKQREGKDWGWKDPRTSLTICAWHPLLVNPNYIFIIRNVRGAAESIMRRGPSAKTLEQWVYMSQVYIDAAKNHLEEVDSPRLVISYENLINKKLSMKTVGEIVDFLSLENRSKKIEIGFSAIKLGGNK